MTLGANIRKHREALNLTQRELADKLGVTEKAVSAWEVGSANPRMGKLQALAEIFDVKLLDLVEDSPSQEAEPQPDYSYKNNYNFIYRRIHDLNDNDLRRFIAYAQKIYEARQILKEGEEDDNL